MSLVQPATNDLALFDALEMVALRRAGSTQSLPVPGALRRVVSRREAAASGGRYTVDDVRFHLPAALVEQPPAPGSMIVDRDGRLWTVLATQRSTLGARWVCNCRLLAVAEAMNQRVSLERAVWRKGRHGAPGWQWKALRLNLLARVQPQHEVLLVRYDRRDVRVSHRVFLGEPAPLEGQLRVVADSAIYLVVGQASLDRIDALPVLLTERIA